MSTPRKSQRTKKPVTIWEEKRAPPAALDPKITEKTARNQPETALKSIVIGSLLKSIQLDLEQLPKLPIYYLLLKLYYKPSESSSIGLPQLQTFKRLFPQEIVDIIVNATNSYTENTRICAKEFNDIRK
jgi:hypothetical protein